MDEKDGGPLSVLHVCKRGIFLLRFRSWGRSCWKCSDATLCPSPVQGFWWNGCSREESEEKVLQQYIEGKCSTLKESAVNQRQISQ